MVNDRNVTKPHIDAEKLWQAIMSFSGALEKAQTLEEARNAGHMLKMNARQAKVKP